jgi:hypothetical protein
MILKVGATSLPQNEVRLRQVEKTGIIGPRGYFNGYRMRAVISGIVREATQSALKTTVDARIALFNSKDYNRDIGLYFNNGTTPTSDILTATGSTNGVVIRNVTWSDEGSARGAMVEWVYYRHYTFVADVEFADASQSTVVSYSEGLEIIGDGSSDYAILECLTATPQPQTTKLFTKQAFRQWGSAVGLLTYEAFPLPLATPKPKGIRRSRLSPQVRGRLVDRNWPCSWSYYGEATGGLDF